MDCKDARRVWNHEGGPIEAVKEFFPEAWDRLHTAAHQFAKKSTNSYNEMVQKDAEQFGVKTYFYVQHAKDGDSIAKQIHDIIGDVAMGKKISEYFSVHCRVPMAFGNICCDGCSLYDPAMSDQEIEWMQLAAIKNNPE